MLLKEIGPLCLLHILFTSLLIYAETGPVSGKHKENEKLRNTIQRLEDENNMLKLKTEILLDMVSRIRVVFFLRKSSVEDDIGMNLQWPIELFSNLCLFLFDFS